MTDTQPDWRERAIAKTVAAARTKAEERVQRFLDAAFALIDEKGSTDFTIQEVLERSNQSLRAFYECFDSKDELVLALFEETVHEAFIDIQAAVEAQGDPVERLRAYALTLHEWCNPHARHDRRRALAEFSAHLAAEHTERVRGALRRQTRLLRDLVEAAVAAGAIHTPDVRHTTELMHLTIMYSAFSNRMSAPNRRLDAESTWQFCLHGLGG